MRLHQAQWVAGQLRAADVPLSTRRTPELRPQMRDYGTDPRALNMPWVFSPFFEELVASRSFSDADRRMARAYRNDGYVVLEAPVVDGDIVDQAIADLEGRYDDAATGYATPSRKLDAWRFSDAVVAIARAAPVVDTLQMLYGRRAFAFQTLSFRVGTQQSAHSDTVHFHSIPQRFMAGVWVALEDIHPDSGPLRVYPGSHGLPVLDPFDLGLAAEWESYNEYESAIEAIVAAASLESHELDLKKGQAVIWAANLLHGGSPVRDAARTRLSQATHYYFDDCLYYQPAASDPFVGRLALKRVEEVGTGRVVPNLYRGRPVEEWLAGGERAWLKAMLARVGPFGRRD